jgi:hypothetical protein
VPRRQYDLKPVGLARYQSAKFLSEPSLRRKFGLITAG